jgi:hypothetical protein
MHACVLCWPIYAGAAMCLGLGQCFLPYKPSLPSPLPSLRLLGTVTRGTVVLGKVESSKPPIYYLRLNLMNTVITLDTNQVITEY